MRFFLFFLCVLNETYELRNTVLHKSMLMKITEVSNIDLSMYEYKHVEKIQKLICFITYFLYNPDF